MHIQFKKVRWKNFLSTGNQFTEIDLDQNKISMIIGSNGSGKSTLLDVICFVLFNKAFRNINKPMLVNSITGKDCIGEVEFIINGYYFRVVRGVKPTLFEIYKDGEIITQAADNRDYQDAFEKYIIKCNYKSFTQICILGSAIFTPFMALSKGARRDIIEDLLDLQIFTNMNNILKEKIEENYNAELKNNNERKIVSAKIKLMKEHNKKIQENTESLVSEKKLKILQTERQIDEINSEALEFEKELLELVSKTSGRDSIQQKIKELYKIQHQISHKINFLMKETEFLSNSTQCPTCHQKIDDEFKNETIKNKDETLAELKIGLNQLDSQLEKMNKKMVLIQEIQEQIDSKNSDLLLLKNKESLLRKYIEELNFDIKNVRQNSDILDTSNLQLLEENLKSIDQTLKDLNEERTIMGYAGVMLKDSGIKAKIIKSYIPVINQLLAKYTSLLDFFVDFQLDENFEETIKSRHRDDFSYESFSEGEKMRLNLAVLFTWRAIAKMRNSIDTNLLIFDEVLDGSIDNTGIDDFTKLLNSLTNNENVVIISHKDVFVDKFDKVIKFEKIANFSRIVE